MVTTTLMAQTFAEWLLREMNQRHIGARELSRMSGITHTTINAWLALDTAEKPHYPTVPKLIKLSRAMDSDLCAMIALLWPDGPTRDAELILMAERMKRLPPDKLEIIDDWLLGTTF